MRLEFPSYAQTAQCWKMQRTKLFEELHLENSTDNALLKSGAETVPPTLASDRVRRSLLLCITPIRRLFGTIGSSESRPYFANVYGLFHRAEKAQLRKADEILLPAYYCVVMMRQRPSVLHLVFVAFRRPLQSKLQHVRNASRVYTGTLGDPLLGSPQMNMQAIRNRWNVRNLLLIENCNCDLLGGDGNRTFESGSFGDYVIAGPRKFYPEVDGGPRL
jgi:hypothetical protein